MYHCVCTTVAGAIGAPLAAAGFVDMASTVARSRIDRFAVMDRGEVVLSGTGSEMIEEDVRRFLTV